jgi:hypothetical protein
MNSQLQDPSSHSWEQRVENVVPRPSLLHMLEQRRARHGERDTANAHTALTTSDAPLHQDILVERGLSQTD